MNKYHFDDIISFKFNSEKFPFLLLDRIANGRWRWYVEKKLLVARVSAVVFENMKSFFSLAFLKVAKEISSFLAYHFLSIWDNVTYVRPKASLKTKTHISTIFGAREKAKKNRRGNCSEKRMLWTYICIWNISWCSFERERFERCDSNAELVWAKCTSTPSRHFILPVEYSIGLCTYVNRRCVKFDTIILRSFLSFSLALLLLCSTQCCSQLKQRNEPGMVFLLFANC